MRVGIIQRAAIMRAQDKETYHFGIVLLEHLADGEKVAQAFGHLFLVHIDEAVMYPVIHVLTTTSLIITRKRYAGGCPAATLRPFRRLCTLALGDLILVMRELQIRAAAVNVEM